MELPISPPPIPVRPPPIPKSARRPSVGLVVLAGGLVVANGARGFAEGMMDRHEVAYALGRMSFCVVFPLGVALLFTIGKPFRNFRAFTKIVLWSAAVTLVAGGANTAVRVSRGDLSLADVTGRGSGQVASPTAAESAAVADLARVFPELYWCAADACLRETTRHGFGFAQSREDFVKAIAVHVDKVEVVERRGAPRCTARLRFEYSDTPAEHWVLEFARTGSKWEPVSGYKYAGGKRTSDLFEDDYLGFIKIMGSMKPYFEKALAAYSEGKDFRVIFPQKQAVR